jgi:hypothetical protein
MLFKNLKKIKRKMICSGDFLTKLSVEIDFSGTVNRNMISICDFLKKGPLHVSLMLDNQN